MTAKPFPQSKTRPVESVQRALQVLQLFLNLGPGVGLSVSETARTLGVATSTTSRLLATLASEGFVMLNPDTRRYHLGVVAFQVGSKFTASEASGPLYPVLDRLAEATGHTAQMGTLHQTKVLYLAVAQSDTRLRVVASPGDVRDAHTSAMGKAMLAALPDPVQEAYIQSLMIADGQLRSSGPGTIVDPDDFRQELRRISHDGYSVSQEEATEGVSALGIRVSESKSVPLALSVAFPSGRDLKEQYDSIIEQLKWAARAASSVLLSGSQD